MDAPVTAKAAILEALVQGETFGLELIKRVEERTNGKLRLGQGSVYPALRELEREGLVKSWEGDQMPERGGRPRRYYKLTAAGGRALRETRTIVRSLFFPSMETV